MIKAIECKHTQALFAGERRHRHWQAFQGVAEGKLQMLNRATRREDRRAPPRNRLEALKRDRWGQWSIRIHDIARERRAKAIVHEALERIPTLAHAA